MFDCCSQVKQTRFSVSQKVHNIECHAVIKHFNLKGLTLTKIKNETNFALGDSKNYF